MNAAGKLLLLLISNKNHKAQKTIRTSTGISSYFYMVKTPNGKIRRMETIANNIEQAQELATREVAAYKGKMLCKVKLARKYEWQRPV